MAGYAAGIDAYLNKALATFERTRRAVIIKTCTPVIMDTPVLRGRLRSNWRSSVKSPMVEQRTESWPEGEADAKSAAVAIGELNVAVASLRGDDTFYLRNNLPYARRVEEDGWSHTKAPQGMLRRNVARIQRNLASALRASRGGS